jgi:trk system potassium uptake protein TrkA
MKVVLIGAGEVGYEVARTLSRENVDVTVIEGDEARADKVDAELDVQVVRGSGIRPQLLEEAGVFAGCDVDVLIACTNRDEVNILACQIGRHCQVKQIIARAKGLEYTDSPTWAKEFGIDVMISPERSVARQILELLSVSSAVHTVELLDGKAAIYAFRVAPKSPLIGIDLKEFRSRYRDLASIVVYIERDEEEDVVPRGDTVFQENDLCYLVTYKSQSWRLEELFQMHAKSLVKRVIVVGGGKIGFQVADRLLSAYPYASIKLIDSDHAKCQRLAGELEKAEIFCGDGADVTLLKEEGIEEADGFVCATDRDEVNLLYCVIAKSLGAKKTVAVVRRKSYAGIQDQLGVDAIVDPNEALASVILRYIRFPSSIAALSLISKINAEMIEIIVGGKSETVGRSLMELTLPRGVLVALIARGKKVFVPDGGSKIFARDRVVLFTTSEQAAAAVELFRGEKRP